MSTEFIALIGAVITALISAFTVIFQTIKKQQGQQAQSTDSIADAATKVVQMQNAQIESMEGKIEELECEMKKLRRYVKMFRSGVKKLTQQVEECGVDPVWTPEELPPYDEI